MRPGDDVRLAHLAAGLGAQHDHRLDRLAAVGVARADHAGLGHRRMAVEQQLHLRRPDLEAAGVDHALEPVGEEEVALLVHAAEIAGAEEAPARHAGQLDEGRLGRGPVLPVAGEQHRPAGDDLADLAGGQLGQRDRIDHPRVGAEQRQAQALQLGPLGRIGVAGRGGLGQAVALGEGQAEVALQPLGHRLRHRRAAAAEKAQAREVQARRLRAGEQVDDHRRDAGPVADAVARDQPPGQHAVPARHHHHRRAAPGRRQHAVDHAGDVEEGHHAQRDRLGADMAPQRAADDVGHQRAVGVHAALGQAGGAGGVGQQHQVVGPGEVRSRRQAGGQRVGPAGGALGQGRLGLQQRLHRRRHRQVRIDPAIRAEHVVPAGHQQRAQALRLGQARVGLAHHLGQLGRADDHLRVRIGDVVAELVGAVHRIDRHHHRVGAHHRVQRDDELRAVLHEQRHPVAAAHALRLQPAGQRLGLAPHLAPAPVVAQAAPGGLVRPALRGDLEVEPQRGLGHRQLARQAGGPVLQVRTVGGNRHREPRARSGRSRGSRAAA